MRPAVFEELARKVVRPCILKFALACLQLL
jgi:hypothetical protein